MNVSNYQLISLLLVRLPRYSCPLLYVNGNGTYLHNEEMKQGCLADTG